MTDILKIKQNGQWIGIPAIKGEPGDVSDVKVNGTSVVEDSVANITMPVNISDLTDDTSTNPIDKADTLTGLTATVEELNVLDGITASTVELNYNDGLTGSVQPQLDNKLNRQQITNCILEDPQSIKLELNNGILTLKAGSVVCVPNGFESDGTTPKFDEVVIESDIGNITGFLTNTMMLFYSPTTSSCTIRIIADCVSGASTTKTQHYHYYNTTTNKLGSYGEGGSLLTYDSFPIAIFTCTNGSVTSISQTFQSIGYIGSTVFVRKGLKGLGAHGRNADGSLKNRECQIISNCIVSTFTSDLNNIYVVFGNNTIGLNGARTYNPTENYVYNGTTKETACECARYDVVSGKISNFQPYIATNILKYSDKSQISGWGMPSGHYVDLTLGASGSTYIAPANGWVVVRKFATDANQFLYLYNVTEGFEWINGNSVQNWNVINIYIPIKKGQVYAVGYTLGGATEYFRFIYAEGEA